MRRVATAIVVVIVVLLASAPVDAQSSPPPPPGPYVIDVRAPISGVPSSSGFQPDLPSTTLVPKRGFGVDVGAHIYPVSLGPARIGFGVDVMHVRGTAKTPAQAAATTTTTATSTTTDTTTGTATTPVAPSTSALDPDNPINVVTTMTVVAPQLSFNFGTKDGWSYLSGGYGFAQVHSTASGTLVTPLTGTATFSRDDGYSAAINYGGGARWYTSSHIAVGFDLRFNRIAALGVRPTTKFIVASVGLSFR